MPSVAHGRAAERLRSARTRIEVSDAVVEACMRGGTAESATSNGEDQEGGVLVPADGEERAAVLGGASGLSASGDGARQSSSGNARARLTRASCSRGEARGSGVEFRQVGQTRTARANKGSDPLRRRGELTATVAAFGHRIRGAVAAAWGSRSWPICRASARICRTTTSCRCSTACGPM